MKTNTNFWSLMIAMMLLTSCGSVSYYQVYEAAPVSELKTADNYLFYEDEHCKVEYNFWDAGGNIGFSFYNKTDNNIYINLEDSFFILNGVAYDYFQNRVFTNTKNSGTSKSGSVAASKSVTGFNFWDLLQTNSLQASSSASTMVSSGYAVSYAEDKVIVIPSKTAKIVTEYNINEALYRDCDLFKYPTKKQINTVDFSKNDSPIVFSNRITYKLDGAIDHVKFENAFYVAEISNLPESEFLVSKSQEYCGQKSKMAKKFFKETAPDKFYIRYTKGTDPWKH